MKRFRQLFIFLFVISVIPITARAQLSSGIISSSRAIDWTQAGFPGAVPPDATWTQCGPTIAAYSGSGSIITNQTATCSNNQYVQLGAGTFNITGFIVNHDNVVVRGMGANQTFIVSTGGVGGCWGGAGTNVCLGPPAEQNGAGNPDNVCDWTAGYTPGSTVLTFANCGTTAPAKGSISNLHVGSIMWLDQLDELTDTGTIWNCNGSGQPCLGLPGGQQGGAQRTDGPCNGVICTRGQQQAVVVTAINGLSITISPGVYMPNWRSSQHPQVWFPNTTATLRGIEDFSLDNTGTPDIDAVFIENCYKCWVKGIRSIDPFRAHVGMFFNKNLVIENNYLYQGQNHGAQSYGAEYNGVSDSLFVNNICQQVTDSCPNNNGAAEGNVIAYNFVIDDIFGPNTFAAGDYFHAGGDAFNLHEGDASLGWVSDSIHGTHSLETLYRNFYPGNENAGCGSAGLIPACTQSNTPFALYASSRYYNIIGNVLGDPGRSEITTYVYDAGVTGSTHLCLGTGGCEAVYTMGYNGNVGWTSQDTAYANSWCLTSACLIFGPYDPLTSATLMRWGNWDSVTGATRWCGSSSSTGWSTTCGSKSEVPTNLWSCNNTQTVCFDSRTFSNAVPTLGDTGGAMPPSFYFSSPPPFWSNPTTGYTPPFPAIGPDVTGGNLGRCSGGTYGFAQATKTSDCTPGGGTLVTAFGGHANAIPAMECFLHVMGGPPDGTGTVLNFNEASCYGSGSTGTPPPPGTPPAPPTGVTATPQ